MYILFNREWRRSDIRDIIKHNSYLDIEDHEDLKALCICPYAEDDDFYDPDYRTLTFIVPAKWLKETAKELFCVNDLDDWLQNVYTTDESELIFEKALSERQVVMVDFE